MYKQLLYLCDRTLKQGLPAVDYHTTDSYHWMEPWIIESNKLASEKVHKWKWWEDRQGLVSNNNWDVRLNIN